MSNLQYRQSKIQDKRKQTPWRDFVIEIASRIPFNIYRKDGLVSRFPQNPRKSINITQLDDEISNSLINITESNSFEENLSLLFRQSYLPKVFGYGENPNCTFADAVYWGKNVYLSFSVGIEAENILYSSFSWVNISKILESNGVETSSNIFHSNSIKDSTNIFYSRHIDSSSNIWFSSNIIGCKYCIQCNNLINQEYHINNIAYSKNEYLKKAEKILKNKSSFNGAYGSLLGEENLQSKGSNGLGLLNCSEVINGYFSKDTNLSRNIILSSGGANGSSNFYDSFNVGQNSHNFYGVNCAGTTSENLFLSASINNSQNAYYCYYLDSCSFCLGCIGLKNKSYCILNKQYSKEEWYEKVDEIFSQMEKDGALGQFFPATMNPFYFNDTAAYLIDPSFTKEEVVAKGYLWRDEPIKVDIPEGAEVVKTQELDKFEGFDEQGNWNINKDILKKIIQDEQGNVYKIVPMEYDFLMKHGLPLPRKHWLDRMKENFRIT